MPIIKYLITTTVVTMTLFQVNNSLAGVVRPISFGTICANYSGAEVILNARAGNVAPEPVEKGSAFITGGYTGLILVEGLLENGHAEIEFKEKTIYLKAPNGNTMKLDSFEEYSEETSLDDGHANDIRIGAKLHIPTDYSVTSYSGNIPLNITIVK